MAGVFLRQFPGAGSHGVGDEQLAGGVNSDLVELHPGDGALISDAEGPDVGDLVAPELHTHGQLPRGREDVENAAAHREVTALGDNVHRGVAALHQLVLDLFEIHLLIDGEVDGGYGTEAVLDGLHQRAYWRDNDPDPGFRLPQFAGSLPVQAAEHLHPLGDGLHVRGDALMRQGLPGGHELHLVTQHGLELLGEILGLPGGRRDHQYRGVLGDGADGEGPHRVGALDRQLRSPDVGDQALELRVARGGPQHTRQRGSRVSPIPWCGRILACRWADRGTHSAPV